MATVVVYGSKLGSTKAAAEYIAKKLNADVFPASEPVDLSKYDKIIIGSGVYAGKPAKAVSNFVASNKEAVKGASLFVSCMYNDDKGADQLEKIANSLGIADAIFFNKVKKQIGVKDSKLELYIESLM